MRVPRFYVPGAKGPEIGLDRSESTHAARVLRMGPGDRIVVFDGAGQEMECEVVETRPVVRARVLERREVRRELARRVTVAAAVPKGWRLEILVQKLAELGAAAYVPIRFERSVARLEGAKLARMRRVAAEACKQCGRAAVMEVELEISIAAFRPRGSFLVALPESDEPIVHAAAPEVTIVIGPEGGFSFEEEESLRSRGARPVRLGPTILRIETAAIAAMSVLGMI